MARELVEQRKDKEKEERNKLFHKVTLDNLFDSIQQGEMKELEHHRQGRRAGLGRGGSLLAREAVER